MEKFYFVCSGFGHENRVFCFTFFLENGKSLTREWQHQTKKEEEMFKLNKFPKSFSLILKWQKK